MLASSPAPAAVGSKGGMMVGWRLLVVAAAVSATLGTSRVAQASEDYPNEAGWGALAVVANVGYMPAKTIYAVFGGITGGLAYACTGGSYQTASSIWYGFTAAPPPGLALRSAFSRSCFA